MAKRDLSFTQYGVFATIVFAVVGAIGWLYRHDIVLWMSNKSDDVKIVDIRISKDANSDLDQGDDAEAIQYTGEKHFYPSSTGEIVTHKHYTLSYVEKHEQAEWTAYRMDRKMHNAPNVQRADRFEPDYNVKTRSAYHRDYSGSGYTRGHLVPAGDMAFDNEAMQESFFMSNMSPQLREFNNGVWKELEENVRDWTYKAGELYIITGPILSNPVKTIGKENKVTVPSSFYKILLDPIAPKAIAFVIPNQRSEARLETYMTTIDEVERLTGLDFFYALMDNAREEKLESTFEPNRWNVSDKRFQLRIDKWNWE
jgi:endonuclease G, mitochondrial